MEAIFQIDVEPNPSFEVTKLYEIKAKLEGEWRKKMTYEGSFEIEADSAPAQHHMSDGKLDGYLVYVPDSKSPTEVYQFDTKRLSYHRLPNYDDFESCIRSLSSFWSFYQESVQPLKAIGVSLRYINSITIEQEGFEFEDYFNFPLPISKEWPEDLTILNSRLLLDVTLPGGVGARISHVLQPPGNTNTLTFLFDIGVKKPVSIENPNFDWLNEAFAELRKAKNLIFFGSISEKTKNLYK